MKTPALPMILALAMSIPAWSDAIPINNNVAINGAGGSVTYSPTSPSIVGFGTTYDGGTYNYSASGTPLHGGRFATGSLTVSTPNFSINGGLSKMFFNPKTGLLQGGFEGKVCEGGSCLNVYHAVFYESINLGNNTNRSGFLVFSTAPEPGSMGLLATGLIGIGVLKRKRTTRSS